MTDTNEMMRDAGAEDVRNGVHAAVHSPAKLSETDAADLECAEFQALMPERIGAGEDLQTNPHMLTCERCRALVRDLELIAEFARELMPVEEEPREDLWAKIQLAIESGEA